MALNAILLHSRTKYITDIYIYFYVKSHLAVQVIPSIPRHFSIASIVQYGTGVKRKAKTPNCKLQPNNQSNALLAPGK